MRALHSVMGVSGVCTGSQGPVYSQVELFKERFSRWANRHNSSYPNPRRCSCPQPPLQYLIKHPWIAIGFCEP